MTWAAHTTPTPLPAFHLARALRETLEAGDHLEPIEFGRPHAVGLTEYVLSPAAATERGMDALYDTLVLFRS